MKQLLTVIFLVLSLVVVMFCVYDIGRIDTRLKLLHSSLPASTVNQCYDAIKGK